ncbi:hypothetical protein [Lactococcus lactis]|jgi:hypothetical protein|nr:hypothetical protein [Lactococcus lactis]MDG4970073.1 hypothetical protein [Lactococcus lactis]MDG4973074.1 hypothetical protein [Lactococcus lactis]MDG5103923.1 hypothetical protein [Lactococcus lactis]USI47177.1 hypothetical protein M5C73_07280 [Lactococcus lactis]WKF73008.1 hypothetical protein QYM42_11615 [Lactococcus lactis]
MNKEIDAEKLINNLLSKITQLQFENAKLSVLVETYEQDNSKEVDK